VWWSSTSSNNSSNLLAASTGSPPSAGTSSFRNPSEMLVQSNLNWGQFHQCSMSIFYACRSQKRKKLLDMTVFFALLGSAGVKAARRTLIKLTPDRYTQVSLYLFLNSYFSIYWPKIWTVTTVTAKVCFSF